MRLGILGKPCFLVSSTTSLHWLVLENETQLWFVALFGVESGHQVSCCAAC